MSVMALAAYLMARAEAGQVKAARKGSRPVSAASLKPLAEEAANWESGGEVELMLDTLRQGGWLEEDGAGYWRPTLAGYSWLQLPPALAHRAWVEAGGGLALPLSTELVDRLIRHGMVAKPENEAFLKRLELLGLVYPEQGQRYRAVAAGKELLVLLTRPLPGPEAGPEDAALLELSYQWQQCFPGQLPGKGWLRWSQSRFCFGFARPIIGQPFTFQPWQLFRLLSLCRPYLPEDANPARYYCQPDQTLIGLSRRNGLEASLIPVYLAGGLRGEIPQELAHTVREWLAQSTRLVVREFTVLETADREIMNELVRDRTLRHYLRPLLSPRHAVLDRRSLKRLEALLQRRGFYLHLASEPSDRNSAQGKAKLVIRRAQLQELFTALSFYRWHLTQMELEATSANLLLELIQKELTMAEQLEAEREATRLINEVAAVSESVEIPPADEAEIRQRLEMAMEQEEVVWIEYYVPGRAGVKRRIEPHQLYERDEKVYLIAHCYLRGGEREFRLDRLRLAQPDN